MIDPPVAQEAYNQLADDYAARIDSKAHNAFYDRPAVISLSARPPAWWWPPSGWRPRRSVVNSPT